MDKSLLEKDGAPTTDELKEFFRNNDYSTAVSSFEKRQIVIPTRHIYGQRKYSLIIGAKIWVALEGKTVF